MPISHVFPRHCHKELPRAALGDGTYLIGQNGKSYLDGSGGAAVSCLGHSDAHHMTAIIKAQIDQVAFAHTGFFASDLAEELADRLIGLAPDGFDRAYLVSGGSEAMEAALKLARQYFIEIGLPKRRHAIARKQSYHGNTLGALATGGNAWRRAPFQPLLVNAHHVSPCYAYRDQTESETDGAYVDRLVAELEAQIEQLGPETVMAFVAELVIGATLGAVPAVDGYCRRMRDLCDRHGILLILDEVMCGLFIGLELVEDGQTKVPFDPVKSVHAKVKAAAFAAGLICYPTGGCIDGKNGDHVLLAPPFILSDDQIGDLVQRLGTAIEAVV